MGRKSISAKHNTHGVKEEITKTYTSSKKEELMKVINAAKQQLDNVSRDRKEMLLWVLIVFGSLG